MTRHVVITTDSTRRGVFAGQLESWDPDKQTAVLINAQMCIYWSVATRGVLGLAATGPAEGSRIGPSVPRIEVNGVTAVIDMSPEAVNRWAEQSWS